MSDVIVSLPSIDDALKALGPAKVKLGIMGSAQVVRGEVVKRWIAGKGAGNESLQNPPISKGYARQKTEAVGRKRIDMHLTGKMADGFGVTELNDQRAVLTFQGGNNAEKARANVDLRPQVLEPDDTLEAKAVGAFNNFLKRAIRFLK